MSLIIDQALWVWVAAALAVMAAIAARAFRGRSRRFLAAGILLPLGAAGCVALALAGLTLARNGRGPVLIMLDFSGSTRASPWRNPAWVRQLAEKRLGPGREVAVAAFSGQECRLLLPRATPGDPSTWPARLDWEPASNATAIATALQWDAPTGDNATARWIITDGLWRLPETPVAARGSLAITVVREGAVDAAVRDVIVRSGTGGAVEILAQVRVVHDAATAVSAPLEVRRDGIVVASLTVDFAGMDSTRWITLSDRPPGQRPHRYEVAIKLAGDRYPENDAGSAIWPGPPDAPRVLVLGQRPPLWLDRVGGTFLTPAGAWMDAQELAADGWQAVILSDMPAESDGAQGLASLPASTAKSLDAFVRQTGGGLLLLNQGHAFGPGRYGEGSIAGDILEELSPVASRPPIGGSRHIVFVLDASASMNEVETIDGTSVRRITLLGRAVEEAVQYLGTADRVTAITFNREARLIADEHGGAAGAALLREKLSAVEPMGETAPDSALGTVAAALGQTPGAVVILITDGEIPSMDVPMWEGLFERTSVSKLIIIAPAPVHTGAPAVAPSTLERLVAALPGTTWTKPKNPAGWPDILRQVVAAEVRGKVLTEPPLSWRLADDPAAPLQIAPAWTQTWQRPESALLAVGVSDSQMPVAAIAQRGLGKVGAITIFDDGLPGYEALLESTLKKVTGGPGDRRFSTAVTRTPEGQWLISADGTAEAAFLNGQSLQVAPIGTVEKTPMRQTAPGHYEARLTASRGLSAVITRAEKSPEGVTEQLVARVQSAAVETDEWPATVDPVPIHQWLPPGAQEISGTMTDSSPWNVPATALIGLSNGFWILAAGLALAALWIRR